MSLSDIRREHVLDAITEYDTIGRNEFLSRYGFGPARAYRVAHGGRLYDSKAIVGVAHGYATGTFLRSGDFTGGHATVERLLTGLEFVVDVDSVSGGFDAPADRSPQEVRPQDQPSPPDVDAVDMRGVVVTEVPPEHAVTERFTVEAALTEPQERRRREAELQRAYANHLRALGHSVTRHAFPVGRAP